MRGFGVTLKRAPIDEARMNHEMPV